MKFLSTLFALCGAVICWAGIHWSLTDVGVVRMGDNFYFAMSLVGVAQFNAAFYGAIDFPFDHPNPTQNVKEES